MKIFAIKNKETRCGYNLCTRSYVKKHILDGSVWQLRLADTDNETIDINNHVFYEGDNANELLSVIESNNGWGVFGITEVKTKAGNILDAFFSTPRQYVISLENLLTPKTTTEMEAYNYLDVDPDCRTLVIDDGESVYEFFEPDMTILESCENWTYMDCKNYMRNNEPTSVK